MKPRIHLIGGPGSGRSYAATRLSSQIDVPAYDLDDLFWDRTTYDVRTEPAARDRKLAALVERDGWIIEGVYYGWVAPSFAAADIIISMMPSIAVRQWRVVKRFVLRKPGGFHRGTNRWLVLGGCCAGANRSTHSIWARLTTSYQLWGARGSNARRSKKSLLHLAILNGTVRSLE